MWHPVKQNSEDACPCCGLNWMELRAGKVTGSTIARIMANEGRAFGDPAHRLAVDIAVFELGGQVTSDSYSNGHMERGIEQEPIARQKYSEAYFVDVADGGFYDNGQTGCSPDGLIGEDGLVQFKCVINSQQYHCVETNKYDSAWKWQLIFELKESGRKYTDYVSYCATFPRLYKQLFVYRIKADSVKDEYSRIDTRLKEFRKLVEAKKEHIRR